MIVAIMIITRRIISLNLLFVFSVLMSAQGFLRTNGKEIVNDDGPILLRSIGTGNWMIQEGYMMQSTNAGVNTHTQFRTKLNEIIGKEKTTEFYNYWLLNQFKESDLDSMKSWGFNAVRPALHYKWFTLPIEQEKRNLSGELDNTWLPKGFAMLDSLVAWCSKNEMYVIFDMHGTPGGQGKDANISDYDPKYPSLWESEDNQKKLVALWTKIADRYQNEKWVGGYDIINEPNWNVDGTGNDNGCGCEDNKLLWDIHQQLISAIRKVDTNHIIFLSGNCWGNNYAGVDNHSLLKENENIALTFHKYWNSNHSNSIGSWLEMREKYNLPIWMSESGENSNQWFADAIQLFEDNNIGWSWWPVKKSRLNNVMRVTTPQNYIDLIKAWEEGQTPLDPNKTYEAVMDYAEAQKTENCNVGRDVIFAMMHNGSSEVTKPFKKHEVGQWIQCVDYDLGKDGFAYHDEISENIHVGETKWTVWNNGNQYRNDGVDIGKINDVYYVGWTADDEWLQYTLDISEEGIYSVQLKSSGAESSVNILVNGKTETEIFHVTATGDTSEWTINEFNNINLPEGEVQIRIYFIKGGCNVKSFKLLSM